MGVIIRQMDKPKSCYDCPLEKDGTCLVMKVDDIDTLGKYSIQTTNWCPLEELPKHGKLIDTDMIPYIASSTHVTDYDIVTRATIDRMPAVIEADR